jgi:hypothetical protein
MSEAPRPGLFSRAESGARTIVIVVGSGIMAFVLGGVVMSGIAAPVADWVGRLEHPVVAFVVAWLLQRVWLWLALPAAAWVVGRVLRVTATTFAIGAALAGEVFGALLTAGTGGVEMLFLGWVDLAARLLTLAVGVWLTKWAAARGEATALAEQARSSALTAQQQAEYAQFVARASGEVPRDEPSQPVKEG